MQGEKIKKDMFLCAKNIEESLGLPKNYVPKLLKEDDWSFIIKIHVLIEAAISFLLLKKFGNNNLIEVINRLELSDKKKGKMAFVRSLDLLEKEVIRFIHTISEIRNKFAHDIKCINIDLNEFFSGLDQKQKKNLINSLTFGSFLVKEKEELNSLREVVQKDLKMAIWLGLVLIFALIYIEKERTEIEKEYKISVEDIIKKNTGKNEKRKNMVSS